MVFHSCFNNLKGVVISRPPLVVFTLCLTALAIATLSLARLVSQTESLPNPDVRLDWNLLLERMAGLELCVLPEDSSKSVTAANASSSVQEAGAAGGDGGGDSKAGQEKEGDSVSVSALLGLAHELHGALHNNTFIAGTMPATLLGLRGTQKMTVSFRVDTNTSSGTHSPSSVCAIFTGPRSLLPATREPPSCSSQTTQVTTGLAVLARLLARPQGPQMANDWCEEGTVLRLAYHSNPSLTAMLTLHDRSVVNLHLMHTSYFLLVMAMTLVCYALLRGKHNKTGTSGNSTLEKVPLGV